MRAYAPAAVARPACFVCLCALLAGCSPKKYGGPARYPLSGKVSADGEPVETGNITFLPAAEGGRVSGGTIEKGAYAVPEEKGANAGPYRVEIRASKKTGKKLRDPNDGSFYDELAEFLPDRYHKNSELTADVSAAKTTFDFDLRTK